MFDTMTMTKAVGALCGALLIFLLGNWAAESLFHVGGGHGDEEHVAGYMIETGSDDAEVVEEKEIDVAAILASGDAGKGARVFNKCKACHKIEAGANATGPSLYDVVGRAIDSEPGFSYSGALLQVGDTWTPEALFHFLEDPKGVAPGTAMGFAGLKKPTDRANLIAYLETLGG